eukprot:GHVT01049373.1.p1 GENE.GHVT01049373.1~~GHVT01049373.1.p1  ORF type:complete len:369 (+),score=66.75 GHVT01049373.1:96-1202(+)
MRKKKEEKEKEDENILHKPFRPRIAGVRSFGLVSLCEYSARWIMSKLTPVNRYQYCKRHNYVPLLHLTAPLNGVDLQHSKLLLLLHYMNSEKYNWLVWMDCDSLILNFDVTLDGIVDQYARETSPDGTTGTAATPASLLITEEGWGFSSANFFIRNCSWSKDLLRRAFLTANQIPIFGDQDALTLHILLPSLLSNPSAAEGEAEANGRRRPALPLEAAEVAVVPQRVFNSYDQLNAFALQCDAYEVGDFLITFPGCHDYSLCNAWHEAAIALAARNCRAHSHYPRPPTAAPATAAGLGGVFPSPATAAVFEDSSPSSATAAVFEDSSPSPATAAVASPPVVTNCSPALLAHLVVAGPMEAALRCAGLY